MKYEFITKDEDTSILKYKDKEFSFTKDVALITKLQNINFDARNEMIMYLAKKGMTTDDLIIKKVENGKRYEDERNLRTMENNYIMKESLKLFDDICQENTKMTILELSNDIGLNEDEATQFGKDLRKAIFGTSTPSESK